jgi:FkbM family methyltransferase
MILATAARGVGLRLSTANKTKRLSIMSQRITLLAVKLLIAIVVLCTTGYIVFVFYPHIALISRTIAQYDSICSVVGAVTSYSDTVRIHQETGDRIARNLKVFAANESGYYLAVTRENHHYLLPVADTKELLAHLLAEQERGIYGSGDSGVRPGDVVLDCGAHVGVYTRKALDSGARLVVAIEPAPENVKCLRYNFSAEITQGRVIICPKGVWDREAFLSFHVNRENSARDSFFAVWPGADDIGRVPLTTIDHLVSELKIDRVDFIKMDIEGAEKRALLGATSTLRMHKPRLAVAAYHEPDDPKQLPAIVSAAVPEYKRECGPYAPTPGGIIPEVLYFHVPRR